MSQRSRKGKGSYLKYKTEGRRIKNKKRDIERHLKHCPEDEQAKTVLGKL